MDILWAHIDKPYPPPPPPAPLSEEEEGIKAHLDEIIEEMESDDIEFAGKAAAPCKTRMILSPANC